MKAFRSTGIMVVLVALLAGYTYYEYKNAAEDAEIEKGERRIFHLLRDDLEEINLEVNGTETVIRRDGAGWKVTKPVEDVAEQSAVEGFLYTLLTQKGKEFQDEKNPNWASFGLDAAKMKVAIKGKGKTESMLVGKNAFDGRFYIRVGDDLWMGDIGLAQLLEREPNSFRTRRVYRGPEDVREVEIHLDYAGMKENYALKRTAGDKTEWTMTPDPGFPLDSMKIQAWVQKLAGVTGTDFVSEIPKGLPSMTAKLGEWTITFSQDTDGGVYITSNKNPFVYKTAASALTLVRVPRIYFRDGKLPFQFDLEQVREIRVSGKVNESFVRKDQSWELKRAAADKELDQEKLIQMVQNIKSLEAADFDAPQSAAGEQQQVDMLGAKGEVLFSMNWGGEYKSPRIFNKGQELRVVRISGGKIPIGVAKDKLDRLVDSAIIKRKTPENKAAKTESR